MARSSMTSRFRIAGVSRLAMRSRSRSTLATMVSTSIGRFQILKCHPYENSTLRLIIFELSGLISSSQMIMSGIIPVRVLAYNITSRNYIFARTLFEERDGRDFRPDHMRLLWKWTK